MKSTIQSSSRGKDIIKRSQPSNVNAKNQTNKKVTVEKASPSNDQVCDICAQNIPGPERQAIFAFGKCDHYVCYVCSARLRVICDQSDCPICREKLETVIFAERRSGSFAKFDLKSCIFEEKYNIYFENHSIKDAFEDLFKFKCLECSKTPTTLSNRNKTKSSSTNDKAEQSKSDNQINQDTPSRSGAGKRQRQTKSAKQQAPTGGQRNATCSTSNIITENQESHASPKTPECSAANLDDTETIEENSHGILKSADLNKDVFPDIFKLKNHLQYVHKLRLCDLCLTHTKLFPFEYNYYDSLSLKKHMKDGEPKTSHRGHPNCILCHNTFFNNDELLQHMSREHFHCHLCARHDSHHRIYFLDYSSLREHFKSKHFLCERDNCRHEQFTSAFENRIEYQLHIVHVHEPGGSNLSRGGSRQHRTITLDSVSRGNRDLSPSAELRRNLPRNVAIVSTGNVATSNRQQNRTIPESISLSLLRQQRLPSRNEFPVLGQEPPTQPRHSPTPTSTSVQISYPPLPQTSAPARPLASPLAAIPGPSSLNFTRAPLPMSQRMNPANIINLRSTTSYSAPTSFVSTLGGGIRRVEDLTETDFPPLPEQSKPSGSKKTIKKGKNWANNKSNDKGPMTLDRLFGESLLLDSNKKRPDLKKMKNCKSAKQKPLKIQL